VNAYIWPCAIADCCQLNPAPAPQPSRPASRAVQDASTQGACRSEQRGFSSNSFLLQRRTRKKSRANSFCILLLKPAQLTNRQVSALNFWPAPINMSTISRSAGVSPDFTSRQIDGAPKPNSPSAARMSACFSMAPM